MASCKRIVQLGTTSGIGLFNLRNCNASKVYAAVDRFQSDNSSMMLYSSLAPGLHVNKINYRHLSQLINPNGKRVFLVDTLALMRSLEAQGIPSKQAEAIRAAITEVLNDSLENVAMEKIVMVQEANLSNFKSEVNSSQV